MPVDEARRHAVYEALRAVHGEVVAASMMEMLPPAGVPELATKADLALLKSDFDLLRAEFRGEIGELRAEFLGEIGELRAEFLGEIGELRAEMGELRGGLRAEFRGELAAMGARLEGAIRDQGRFFTRILVTVVPAASAAAAVVGGLTVRLG